MIRIKILLTLITLLSLSGCAVSNYYVLSSVSQPKVTYKHKSRMIGIEKITVPKYLFKREIAVAKSASQIIFLDGAVWAEDLDEGLTHRLIGFLQKKFREPSIYAYPWGTDKQPDIKIKVQVTRFIAQGDKVYLDANWEVIDLNTQKRKARLFSTSVSTSSKADMIVNAMNEAFGHLEETLAIDVNNFSQ